MVSDSIEGIIELTFINAYQYADKEYDIFNWRFAFKTRKTKQYDLMIYTA